MSLEAILAYVFSHWYIPPAIILGFSVLVFVHEWGHYIVARLCGVRVETFSIGFGRAISLGGRALAWTDSKGTQWKISWLPLGGYVKFFGDADGASRPDGNLGALTEEERKVSFHHKSVGRRAAIVAAGPVANFVLAILMLAGLYVAYGQPYTAPVAGAIEEGSAAHAAGFLPGDTFLAIDGTRVKRFEDIPAMVRLNTGTPLQVLIARDGVERTLTVTPQITVDAASGARIPRLGIRSSGAAVFESRDPLSAVWVATEEVGTITNSMLVAVGQIFTGARGTEDLGGPVKIVQIMGEAAQQGTPSLIWILALLSINLGLMNLFPVPMLDGGHLMFYAFEAVRGRPLGERAQEYGFRVGLFLILSLMVFVTFKDVVGLFT
ncbi:RIP metalloprotease RseP [Zavarzinia sp. CC-PAN008]|uniref:RIP metalloprotease RseP n=1 Tax=Zavarzinia sp. CC-PAN008 TaxID=3243332 RepID=UPI003F745CA0